MEIIKFNKRRNKFLCSYACYVGYTYNKHSAKPKVDRKSMVMKLGYNYDQRLPIKRKCKNSIIIGA